MNKFCLLGLAALVSLITFPLAVSAEDEEAAKYNFASAQGSKELQVSPGAQTAGAIYFYNIDGNRITHITLEVSEAPSGWTVSVEPPLSETEVLVSGMPVTVTENLYVEPGELFAEEPQTVPEGMVSIKVPGRGYALGKLAQVLVSVPDSVPLGTTGEIVIAAEASWLGQSGSAAVKQARDFDFTVTVVSESSEFSEVIVGEDGTDGVAETTGTTSSGVTRWWPAIVGGAVAAVIGGVVGSRRRAAKKKAARE
jgi:hypothetical protein